MSGPVDPEPVAPSTRLWSPIALLALLGGIAAIVGVFLAWADPSRVSLDTERLLASLASGFGLDPSSVPGTGVTPGGAALGASVPGRADALGIGAALSGFVAVTGAVLALLMPDARMRRIGGIVAVGAGLAVIAFAASAWVDAAGLVLEEIVDQVRAEADRQLDLLLPGVPFAGLVTGPLLDRLEGALRASLEVEAVAGVGLLLSLVGGGAATLGGVAIVVRELAEGPDRLDPLVEVAAQLTPGDREHLLRVLSTPDQARAEAIRAFCDRPGYESWTPVLDELERSPRLRREVAETLRAVQEAT